MVSNGKDVVPKESRGRRLLATALLVFMIVGATVGELPAMKDLVPGMKFDMFFFVCVTTIIMAWTKIFPPKKYTKYISWDILITIACAFAISKAINNSGVAPMIARNIIAMTDSLGPYGLLAVLFIITNVFTELITNNAAAALSFPIALSVANKLLHSDRLSDRPQRARCGRIQVHRLHKSGTAPQRDCLRNFGGTDSAVLGFLIKTTQRQWKRKRQTSIRYSTA